jgi:O-antigen ligase
VTAGLVFVVLAKRLRGALVVVVAAVALAGIAVGLVNILGSDLQATEAVPLATAEIDPSVALRLDTYAKTWTMFTDFPVTGTGLGTFQWTFAGYQRAGEWLTWAHAHNDYLQFLSEAGLVGAVLMAWMLWMFIGRVMRPGVSETSRGTRWSSVGTAAALFAVLIHSMFDFNLQMPSNAVLFAVLAGILTAASCDDRRGSVSP